MYLETTYWPTRKCTKTQQITSLGRLWVKMYDFCLQKSYILKCFSYFAQCLHQKYIKNAPNHIKNAPQTIKSIKNIVFCVPLSCTLCCSCQKCRRLRRPVQRNTKMHQNPSGIHQTPRKSTKIHQKYSKIHQKHNKMH